MGQYRLYKLQNRHLPCYNPTNVGDEVCSPSHSFGPTARTYLLIHYVVSGKGRFTRDGKTHALAAADCFIIRPGEVTYYEADAADPWHYIWVGFRATETPPFLAENDVLTVPYLAPYFTEIAEKLDAYNGAAGDGGVRESFLCGKIAEILAAMAIHEAPPERHCSDCVRIAKNRIDTAYASLITVAGLAAELSRERNAFTRLFKREIGVTPQEYLVTKRLSEAARLMRDYAFSPTAAAGAVGYGDIYLFSKMFKKHYGVSPRNYIDNK